MTYAELQQRRERIEAELYDGPRDLTPQRPTWQLSRVIRALLDDADCGEPPSAFDIAKDTGDGILAAYIESKRRYARALSICEGELGL